MKNPPTPTLFEMRDSPSFQPSRSRNGYWFYRGSVTLATAFAAVLITTCAHGQDAAAPPGGVNPAATKTAVTPAPAAAPASTPTAQATQPVQKYSSRDIQRAFGFLDTNQDGQISREEASRFRNIAKHFDAADVDKSNTLSLQEFGAALNRP